MASMNQLGNDLYTGKTSVPFVGKRNLWFLIAGLLVLVSILVVFLRPPQFSMEFTGGTQFTVSGVAAENLDQGKATEAVRSIAGDVATKVTTVGTDGIRVQTEALEADSSEGASPVQQISEALATAYKVDAAEHVSSSVVGASWGADVTRQSLWGLGIFLALAFVILALYFRTWKMSAAAIIGLLDVLVITFGVYALCGFEISPAAVIGFLTILGYSLYDTTVVFDKIRETTAEQGSASHRTFGESVNLGVNQTLILFIGALGLGAQTLADISLSITVGIIVAAYSTLFVAAPLYSLFRENEPKIKSHDAKVARARERDADVA